MISYCPRVVILKAKPEESLVWRKARSYATVLYQRAVPINQRSFTSPPAGGFVQDDIEVIQGKKKPIREDELVGVLY